MREPGKIAFWINGKMRRFEAKPNETLLDVLRRSGYSGTKRGCGEGRCGACTVIVDGKAVYSCLYRAFQAEGRDIVTIEGVGSFENPHPVQEALVDEGAVQCGYCTPGMVMAAKAMFDANPNPNEEEICVVARDTKRFLPRCFGLLAPEEENGVRGEGRAKAGAGKELHDDGAQLPGGG